ncbi:MAG: SCO family protein [Desulfobulbaceae bacterium]|nr:SCO family protein [Desulfobulbaceae bacterium]
MNNCAKSIALIVVLSMVIGICSSSMANTNEPGLLEQTKQVLAGGKTDSVQWIEEKTGQYLPLDLEFVDEQGEAIRLRKIINRPTILLPIYFYCPNVCSKNLANLAIALPNLSFMPGKDYQVIALSFNEAESSKDAARAKRNYLKIVGDDFPADSWRFLTGKQDAIQTAMDAVGFRFKKIDDETFIHPAALMTITEDGKIIRYVYGSFLAGDIDMGLADAKRGRPSLSVKRLLGFCFNYDPDKNKSVFQLVKIGVMLFFVLVLALVFMYFRRKRPKIQNGL